jgi:hypothetical protein
VIESPPGKTSWNTVRFETKYQLDYFTYQRVKATLSGRVFADEYTQRSGDGKYFVRSLYFDTYDFQAYQEKIIGLANRIKLRLRTYEESPSDSFQAKLEIKCRYSTLVGKFSAVVSRDNYQTFLTNRRWCQDPGPEAIEFRRLALLKDLRPKVLVDYRREAFIPYERRDMRITFDHHLKFAAAQELYPTSIRPYSPHPKLVVLEIKSDGDIPEWLDLLIKQHSLNSVPNSKYAQAIEQTQPGLFSRW